MGRILFLFVISLALVTTTTTTSYVAATDDEDDGPIIGLDFGTFDSCVGVSIGGQVEIIPNQFGKIITPSWVYSGDFFSVGDIAVDLAHHYPHAGTAIFGVKRYLGLHPLETTQEGDNWLGHFVMTDPLTNKTVIHIHTQNQLLDPEFIAGMIMGILKKTAELYIGSKITSAVISVPGVYGYTQRKAIIDAATIGGFKVIKLINDPTSIALAYGINRIEGKKVLVVDFGGSSLDVGIITVVDGNVHVLGGGGSFSLGGRNFNLKLMQFIYHQVRKERNMNPFHDFPSVMKSWDACEAAKIELSKVNTTTIEIQLHDIFKVEYIISVTISRDQFDFLIEDDLLVVKDLILQAIKNANLDKKDIDTVLMVGGSSQVPKFKEILLGLHKWRSVEFLEKENSVAYGAALYGEILSGTKGIQLYDTTQWSVGLEVHKREFTGVIKKNDIIPANKSILLHTSEEKNVTVYERFSNGHRDHTHRLGSITLRKTSKGNVNVTVSVDANGIVDIRDGWNSDAVERVLDRDSMTELLNFVRDHEFDLIAKVVDDGSAIPSIQSKSREGVLISVKDAVNDGVLTQGAANVIEKIVKFGRKRKFPEAHQSHDDL